MSTFWPLEAIAPGLNRKRQKLRFSFTKGSCTKRGLILSQFDNIGPKLVIFQRFIVFENSFEMSYYCINKIIDVPHCSKSSFFVQKFNFNFPRKLSIFFWVKNSWKCCGFGLLSCWQLWLHEKNCQKKIRWKTRENV